MGLNNQYWYIFHNHTLPYLVAREVIPEVCQEKRSKQQGRPLSRDRSSLRQSTTICFQRDLSACCCRACTSRLAASWSPAARAAASTAAASWRRAASLRAASAPCRVDQTQIFLDSGLDLNLGALKAVNKVYTASHCSSGIYHHDGALGRLEILEDRGIVT